MLKNGFIALFAGCLLPFAFSPFHLWGLAFLSPALMLWCWQRAHTPRQAFFSGLFFGLGAFGVGVSWVFVSIHQYGQTNLAMAGLITFLFTFLLALFIGVQGYTLKKFFKGSPVAFSLLGFPCSWVFFEWLRSWVLTGFPWLYLGYAGLDTPLQQYAPVMSVYAVSLAFVTTSGALVTLLDKRRTARFLALTLIVLIWGIALMLPREFTQTDRSFTASLIQSNVGPLEKFSQEDAIEWTENLYGHLTASQWQSDLILWPEGAIPVALPYSQAYIDYLDELALKNNTTLISGIIVEDVEGNYYNSLIALGKGAGLYHKVHLVPFGDFLPFEQWLRGAINFFDLPMSSFKAGTSEQALIRTDKLKLNPTICYEIAFPEQVRKTLRDADVIITLSEDGWFGDSWGPHQHLDIAKMRAIETGRYVLRATTSGITAIINPHRTKIQRIPSFQKVVLMGTFKSMKGQTPWVKIGLWPLLVFLGLGFILPGRLKKKS